MVFALAALLAIAAGGLAVQRLEQSQDANERISRGHDVLSSVEELRAAIAATDAAHRALLQAAPAVAHDGGARARAALARGRMAAAHDRAQQQRLDTLEQLLQAHLDALARTIALVQRGETDSARLLARAVEADRRRDDAHGVLARMSEAERHRLETVASRQAEHGEVAQRSVVGSLAASLVLAAVGTLFLRRAESTARARAVDAAHAAEIARTAAHDAQAGEARYRLLFERLPRPAWVHDARTLAFLAVNPAAVGFYGYSAREFAGMTVRDVEGDGAPSDETVERRHRTRDGQRRDVRLSTHALDYEGRPARLVLVEDVTEQREMELVLRTSAAAARAGEQRFRTALDAMTDPFFLLRPAAPSADGSRADFTVVEVNLAGAAMLGRPRARLLGASLSSVLPAGVLDVVVPICDAVMDSLVHDVSEQRLVIAGRAPQWFRLQVVPMPEGVAIACHDITAVKEVEVALTALAGRDELTGLLNRRGFRSLVSQEIATSAASGRTDWLVSFDLSGFKAINDSYGHPAGDAALRAVARLLVGAAPDRAIVGRLGGDEFAVYVPGAEGDAHDLVARMRRAFADANSAAAADGRPFRVDTGIGVAVVQEGDDLDTLVARADRSLYADKRARSGR